MLDDEKAVEPFECHRRHGEDVEHNDHLTVILEEGKAPLPRVATARHSSQSKSHTPFGDVEAELLKSSVDLGGSPAQVLFRQASDQNTNLVVDLWSAAAWPGAPTPVETEAGAVPADDGLGLHDEEDVGSAGPTAAEDRPRESVQEVQYWSQPFASEHGDLLPKGEDFEGGNASTAGEDPDGGQVWRCPGEALRMSGAPLPAASIWHPGATSPGLGQVEQTESSIGRSDRVGNTCLVPSLVPCLPPSLVPCPALADRPNRETSPGPVPDRRDFR